MGIGPLKIIFVAQQDQEQLTKPPLTHPTFIKHLTKSHPSLVAQLRELQPLCQDPNNLLPDPTLSLGTNKGIICKSLYTFFFII